MKSVRILGAIMLAVCMIAGSVLAGDAKQVKLDVKGMMCGSCEHKVKTSLQKVDGVKSADVDWNAGTALVTLNKADVKNEDLVKAVKAAGSKFDAKVANEEKK